MLTHEQRLALAVKFNKERRASKKAGQIATRNLILADELTEKELQELVYLYPVYGVGVAYVAGDIFQYEGILYEVIQEHISQVDWVPGGVGTASLYKRKIPEGVIADWVQPQGAHDAYPVGAKVKHGGKVWVSTIDNNVWEPGVYGWNVTQ